MSGLFAGTSLERPVTCERCHKSHAQCLCPRAVNGQLLDPKDQPVRVRREKRNGKLVTIVSGLAQRSERTDDLPSLLATLKKKHATGGTLSKGVLELQGDHRDRLVEFFQSLGYPAKPAGG